MRRWATGTTRAWACCTAFRQCSAKGSSSADEALASLLNELDKCELDTSEVKAASIAESVGRNSGVTQPRTPAPRISRREKTEILRHSQLKKLIHEADSEIELLESEHRRAEIQASIGTLAPAKSTDQFFTGSEQVLEKSPQHFVPSAESDSEVEKLPRLRHSGTVGVVTIVGKVTQMPEDEPAKDTTSLLLEYDLPTEYAHENKGLVVAVTRCSMLREFVREHIEVGDVVHVLGQLIPSSKPDVVATVLIPQNGGSVSAVLRPHKQ